LVEHLPCKQEALGSWPREGFVGILQGDIHERCSP
jgi:hypothetical protein